MPDDLYIMKLAKITHKSIPIIGFICIGTYILKNADLSLIIHHLKNSKIQYLLSALILGSSQILVATIRFYLFLRAAGANYKFQNCLKSVTTAIAFNSFLPSKGGDLIKGFILTRNKEQRIRITGITIVERLSDVLTICFLSLIGTTLLWNYKYFSLNIFIILIIIISFLSIKHFFKIPIIGKKLVPVNDIQDAIFNNMKYTVLSLLTCLIFWSINLLILHLLLKSVGINTLAYEIIVFWPYSIIKDLSGLY